MSKVRYLRQTYLDRLRATIEGNLIKYKLEEPWLASHFGDNSWALDSNIALPDDIQLKEPEGINHFDFENTKNVYLALRGLSISQATDERLWAYLTHVHFWKYMRKRWPVEEYLEKPSASDTMRERYFFMANRDRSLVRNGIARLWWYGHVSHDEQREDPFELTRVLLAKLDIAQNLLERSFSRNTAICRAVLSVLSERERDGAAFDDREAFRKLMQHLNRLGGVTVLDALSVSDVKRIVVGKMAQVA